MHKHDVEGRTVHRVPDSRFSAEPPTEMGMFFQGARPERIVSRCLEGRQPSESAEEVHTEMTLGEGSEASR